MDTLLPWDKGYDRPVLRPEHREHLRTSGLLDATVEAAGLCSVDEDQAEALGYPPGLTGLVFPYPETRVKVGHRALPYTRLRVDPARVRVPSQKYENPLKKRLREGLSYYPYVPPAVAALRKDVTRAVFVTEGEKKALKLGQEGFPTIGLPGVHLFSDPTSRLEPPKKPLHGDLVRWNWHHRPVFVCFDSDRVEKEGVALAHERLCRKLTERGALVRCVLVPRLEGHEKTGADDFLVARGRVAFQALVDAAIPWEPYAYLIDLVPRDLPPAALVPALETARAKLVSATRSERREFVRRLCEVHPNIPSAQALATIVGEELPPDGTDPERLPVINVNGRQLLDIVGDAWSALRASRFGPRLFRYGQDLVLVPEGSPAGVAVLQTVDLSIICAVLNRSATWVRQDEEGVYAARVPVDAARDMLALPEPGLRVLDAVVHLPVLCRDGRLVARAGYEPETRIYHFADPRVAETAERIPAAPSAEDRRLALAFLCEELLGDFPFANASDRAHALAALVLPAVRHFFRGPTPLHIVEAPSEGTGKGLLADVVHLVATGSLAQPMTLPTAEEEVRKKITASLQTAPIIVLLDNIGHVLDSASLAAVLTCETWSDRFLGQTRMVTVPNRALWLATANNPTLSRENARRSVRIRLDADVEHPWLRDGFRHPELRAWILENRPAIVAALLTLVRGWLLDGQPPGLVRLGSFEPWSRIVGGVLGSAGVEGFLADRYETQACAGLDEADWRGFVELWWDKHGGAPVTAGDLMTLAGERRLFDLDPNSTADRRSRSSFAASLTRRRDRRYGAFRIVMGRDEHLKQNVYRLEGGERVAA